jgi:hypothetical protein
MPDKKASTILMEVRSGRDLAEARVADCVTILPGDAKVWK